MELARRQLEVTFRRQAGARLVEGRSQLRLKLNNAGIVPTILASWLLLLPFLAANLGLGLPDWIMAHLKQGQPVFLVLYGLAIVLCVFFYTAFLLNPDEIAEDLKQAWRRHRRRRARGGHRRSHRPRRFPHQRDRGASILRSCTWSRRYWSPSGRCRFI